MAVLLNRSVLRPVGRGRSRAWGLGRGGEDGASDVRIIDIRGADERARQPTGGKGPRITSGGPYSLRRSGQTCVHPILSALARARRKRARTERERSEGEEEGEKREQDESADAEEINAILGFCFVTEKSVIFPGVTSKIKCTECTLLLNQRWGRSRIVLGEKKKKKKEF